MDNMGDRWWTRRMFVLTILLSVSCFASGFYRGSVAGFAEGYTRGYTDCTEFVVNLIRDIDTQGAPK